jgi:hypothetical protein
MGTSSSGLVVMPLLPFSLSDYDNPVQGSVRRVSALPKFEACHYRRKELLGPKPVTHDLMQVSDSDARQHLLTETATEGSL